MFWLFIVLVVLNIIDYFSAGFVLGGEANPVFLLTGSMITVLLLKVSLLLVIGYFIIKNSYNTRFSLFLTVIILILSIGATGIAAGGNVYAAFNPVVLEQASQLTQQEKVQGYTSYMFIIYLLPLLLSVLSFKIFEWGSRKAEFRK
jgi:hypothetical protein